MIGIDNKVVFKKQIKTENLAILSLKFAINAIHSAQKPAQYEVTIYVYTHIYTYEVSPDSNRTRPITRKGDVCEVA